MARVTIEINGRTWKKCGCCSRHIGWQRCKFCDKKYRTPKGLEAHEKICYRNPERECPLCHGAGVLREYSEGGMYAEDYCPACEKAKARQADDWPPIIE